MYTSKLQLNTAGIQVGYNSTQQVYK